MSTPHFARRYLNDGFSGGEKKRTEVLQMAMLEPKFALMDESDSGLDIDALRVVADGINKLATPERGFLLITHYQRLLNYVKPHYVSIFFDGRVVMTGGPEVAHMLEETRLRLGRARSLALKSCRRNVLDEARRYPWQHMPT